MNRIPLIKSTFYNEKETKEKLCKFITNADFLSMREECSEYEKSFSNKQERKYSVYVTSGSAANLLSDSIFGKYGKAQNGR